MKLRASTRGRPRPGVVVVIATAAVGLTLGIVGFTRALVKPTMPSVRPTAAVAITTTTPGRGRPRVDALSFIWVSFGEVGGPRVLVHNLYRSAERYWDDEAEVNLRLD